MYLCVCVINKNEVRSFHMFVFPLNVCNSDFMTQSCLLPLIITCRNAQECLSRFNCNSSIARQWPLVKWSTVLWQCMTSEWLLNRKNCKHAVYKHVQWTIAKRLKFLSQVQGNRWTLKSRRGEHLVYTVVRVISGQLSGADPGKCNGGANFIN